MLINEVSKTTGLTKKAVEYYTEQGLVVPSVLENGYREFSSFDIARLNKISILRKLGIGTKEIKDILDDETGESLRKVSVQKELDLQRLQAKKAVLNKLSSGADYSEIRDELQFIEGGATIAEKLLDAFPGYYGRFLCLHFAGFLNEPITTEKQRSAYHKILSFLDNMPSLALPEDLKKYLEENTKHIGTEQIDDMIANTKKSIEHPDDFLENNKEILEQYLALKQSDEYKSSPAFQIQSLLREFNSTSGYYDVFLPALKELSPAYAKYCRQLERADKKMLKWLSDPQRQASLKQNADSAVKFADKRKY